MRARLGKMTRGREFQFICTADMAGKMDRIVTLAGGIIRAKDIQADGTVLTVMKAE